MYVYAIFVRKYRIYIKILVRKKKHNRVSFQQDTRKKKEKKLTKNSIRLYIVNHHIHIKGKQSQYTQLHVRFTFLKFVLKNTLNPNSFLNRKKSRVKPFDSFGEMRKKTK